MHPLPEWKPVIGCVAENTPKFLSQALRLVQSLRWFGGRVADADMVICVVDTVDPAYRERFERYGALVRIVKRYSAHHPPSNKLRFLQAEELNDYEQIVLLDCDTLVVRDPYPFLRRGAFRAKIAGGPTVSHALFKRLFRALNLPLPDRTFRCSVTGEPTILYCNTGVIKFERSAIKAFVPKWFEWNDALIERIDLLGDRANFCEQASLSLALAAHPIQLDALGNEMNFPVQAYSMHSKARLDPIDPFIIHYHSFIDESGYLNPSPYPWANERIDMFNERLRKEGLRPSEARAVPKPARMDGGNKPAPSEARWWVETPFGNYCLDERSPSQAEQEEIVFYPRNELAMALQFTSKGDTILDLGAGIGDFSIPVGRRVGREGRVYAWESSLDLLHRMKRNVELNRLGGVVAAVHAAAVDRLDAGGGRLGEKESASSDQTATGRLGGGDVFRWALDEWWAEQCVHRKIDVIKLGVGRMNLQALRSGEQTVASFRPILCIDRGYDAAERSSSGSEELERFLRRFGYHFFVNIVEGSPSTDYFEVSRIHSWWGERTRRLVLAVHEESARYPREFKGPMRVRLESLLKMWK